MHSPMQDAPTSTNANRIFPCIILKQSHKPPGATRMLMQSFMHVQNLVPINMHMMHTGAEPRLWGCGPVLWRPQQSVCQPAGAQCQ